jgi:hypothetical protein
MPVNKKYLPMMATRNMNVVFKNQTGSANSGNCIIKYRINFEPGYWDYR